MKRSALLAFLLVLALAVPAVHGQKAVQIDYAPRVGATLHYEGTLMMIYYNATDQQTHNITGVLDLYVTILDYTEHYNNYYDANVEYNYTIDIYQDGEYVMTRHDTYTEDLSGDVLIGIVDDENMIFIAINMSYVHKTLYAYTIEFGPENFTARIVDTPAGTGLNVSVYLNDYEEIEYGEFHLTYLLDYGIMYHEYIYAKTSEGSPYKLIRNDGYPMEVYVEYQLVGHSEMDKIPKILDYPEERETLEAERRVYNETDSGYAGFEVNRIVVVGEIILFDVNAYIRTQTMGIMRSSTFGRMPEPDSPRAMPPVLVYPPYLEVAAHEEGATVGTYEIGGKTYTIYVFHEDNGEIAFIKDLGILAYAHNANNTAGVELTKLEYQEAPEEGGETGGESGGGGIGGLSSQQIAVIVLAIVVLVLALLAYMLRRG